LRAYKVSPGEPDKKAGHDRVVVALVPRQPDQAAFKSIEMVVDTQLTMPVEFRVTQLDATQAIVRLAPDKLVLDARTDDRLFRPSFPPEAQVVDMR
jgi:outer membrane lipoprotein-sorting protein